MRCAEGGNAGWDSDAESEASDAEMDGQWRRKAGEAAAACRERVKQPEALRLLQDVVPGWLAGLRRLAAAWRGCGVAWRGEAAARRGAGMGWRGKLRNRDESARHEKGEAKPTTRINTLH
ncbi:hypothetical protein OsI_36262 [Oryza sativa Indica Group]|uniref:Uncharacterized protein n=1 Tax=Oryza sativa subsp. indica TaxID=39946 RepID=A2ZEP8_ORYSI|nr:hypothetical protein OsI_36262 [Oryza sativa Indica Group]